MTLISVSDKKEPCVTKSISQQSKALTFCKLFLINYLRKDKT